MSKKPRGKHLIKKRNTMIGVGAGLLFVIGASMVLNGSGIAVEYEVVDSGTVYDLIEEEARVESRQTQNVPVEVSGVLSKTYKAVGDYVDAGEVLAEIDSTDIDAQLEIAQQELEALKFSFEDALDVSDKQLVRQAQATYNGAAISRDSAKNSYEKNVTLYEQGAISQQTLEDSKKVYDLSQQTVNSTYQELLRQRKGLSEPLKNKYASQIKAKESSIVLLQKQKERHEIRSVLSGIVLSKSVQIGDYVTTGTVAYEIAGNELLYFESDVLDSDIGQIHVGTDVSIYNNDDQMFEGQVTKVFPKAETQVSDLGIEQKRVTVEIETEDIALYKQLLIGQEVDVDFVTAKVENAIRVREELTYMRDETYYVFVLEEGRAVERELQTGIVGDDYIEVVAGLVAGDTVLVPSDDIEPGKKVVLQEEKMEE